MDGLKAKKADKAEKRDRGFAFFFTQKKWDVLFGEHSNKTTFNRKNDEEISVRATDFMFRNRISTVALLGAGYLRDCLISLLKHCFWFLFLYLLPCDAVVMSGTERDKDVCVYVCVGGWVGV